MLFCCDNLEDRTLCEIVLMMISGLSAYVNHAFRSVKYVLKPYVETVRAGKRF